LAIFFIHDVAEFQVDWVSQVIYDFPSNEYNLFLPLQCERLMRKGFREQAMLMIQIEGANGFFAPMANRRNRLQGHRFEQFHKTTYLRLLPQ
jgi:hypothetical protein